MKSLTKKIKENLENHTSISVSEKDGMALVGLSSGSLVWVLSSTDNKVCFKRFVEKDSEESADAIKIDYSELDDIEKLTSIVKYFDSKKKYKNTVIRYSLEKGCTDNYVIPERKKDDVNQISFLFEGVDSELTDRSNSFEVGSYAHFHENGKLKKLSDKDEVMFFALNEFEFSETKTDAHILVIREKKSAALVNVLITSSIKEEVSPENTVFYENGEAKKPIPVTDLKRMI